MILFVLYIHMYYVSDDILLFERNIWHLIAVSFFSLFVTGFGPIAENAQVELAQMISRMMVLETVFLSTNFIPVVTHRIFIGKSTNQLL